LARKRNIISDLDDKTIRKEQRDSTKQLIEMNEKNRQLNEKAPEYLDSFAQQLYEVLAEYLIKNKYVNESDESTLVAFCLNMSMLKQASESIKEVGVVYADSRGNLKRNPSASVINDVSSKIQSLGGSVGFSPSSRVSLQSLVTDDSKPSASDILASFGGGEDE